MPPATPASRSSSRPSRCSTPWPTPSRRRASSLVAKQSPTSVRDVFAASPRARRDLRRGARPRQPRHDHPGRGRGGRGCRRPHRPHRRPLQPQGRPRVDRVALPPAGRGRRRPGDGGRAGACRRRAGRRRRRRGRGLPHRRGRCSPSPPRGCSATRREGSKTSALALADLALRLPIYGRAESLNLATAASVCLYETAFAQRAAR